MKAILISVHAKWCAKIMNGDKTVEVRKGTALYKAIQKLIDEYGYADIYVYCTKDNKQGLVWDNQGKCLVNSSLFPYGKDCPERHRLVNGKVIFKFRCYKVEEIEKRRLFDAPFLSEYIYKNNETCYSFERKTQLTEEELCKYLNNKNGYALHISNLVIFDKPKELSEFDYWNVVKNNKYIYGEFPLKTPLTKAPQSWCYVEVE